MGLEKINMFKKELGLTNAQLSLKSGVPLGTLDKITAGITLDPKLETIRAIAKALGKTLDDFDDDAKVIDLDEQTHLSRYRELSSIGKQKTNAYMDGLLENDGDMYYVGKNIALDGSHSQTKVPMKNAINAKKSISNLKKRGKI